MGNIQHFGGDRFLNKFLWKRNALHLAGYDMWNKVWLLSSVFTWNYSHFLVITFSRSEVYPPLLDFHLNHNIFKRQSSSFLISATCAVTRSAEFHYVCMYRLIIDYCRHVWTQRAISKTVRHSKLRSSKHQNYYISLMRCVICNIDCTRLRYFAPLR